MQRWKQLPVGRGLEWLLGALTWLAGATGALAAAALVALAAWMASPHSLGQSLNWAAKWLARDGDTPLQVQGAEGSLLQGGTVEQLTWTQNTLTLQVQALEVRWGGGLWWNLLASRSLTLDRVAAQQLQIQTRPDPDAPPSPADTDTPPWAGPLTLPWLNRVELPFEVTGDIELTLADSRLPPLQALRGRYLYGPDAGASSVSANSEATAHQLVVEHLTWAEGRYTIDAALQAAAPHTVRARLQGTLAPRYEDAALKNAQGQPLLLQAEATLRGRLGNPNTALPPSDTTPPFVDLQARVETAGATQPNGPTLSAEARMHPWRAQPVQALMAELRRIDLSMFWAGAPSTQLDGRVNTTPGTEPEAGWGLSAQLDNRRAGPWDQGLLPLESLNLQLRQDASGWQLPQLRARLAGSTLRATGRAEGLLEPGGLRSWSLEAAASGLVPSGLLSTLQAVPQDLRLTARSGDAVSTPASAARAVALDVRLAPSDRPGGGAVGGARGVPLPALNLRGEWLPGQLRLAAANLSWQEAQLQAQATLSGLDGLPAFSGQATLTAPGLSAQLEGSLDANGRARRPARADEPGAARTAGVQLRAEVASASTALAWLRRTLARLEVALQPVWDAPPWQAALPDSWDSLDVQGRAQLRASWSDLPPWAASAGASGSAWTAALELDDARFQTTPDATPWQVPEARARITESEVAQLDVSWEMDGAPWRLQLAEPVAYRLATATPAVPAAPTATAGASTGATASSGAGGTSLNSTRLDSTGLVLDAGQLRLDLPASAGAGRREPAQGAVTLHWERTAWTGQRLQSQGRWQDLPLAALDAWLGQRGASGQSPLAAAGLDTTLVLQGDWAMDIPLSANAAAGTAPSATVGIRRQSGDFTLPPELARSAGGGQRVPAGLTESTLALRLEGTQVQAQLRWASERLGDVTAQMGTTLALPEGEQGWRWPDSAPITATARATLPDLAIWSALAPPGWRVNGLVALDVQATGTRAAPDWRGNIVADRLALRSVVDGIDLRDGQLRARFNGRQLDITTLRLVGAGGDGVLEGTGSALWSDSTGLLPDVDLQLKATGLRVLSRADRRLALSGDTRMALRGTDLQVDSALRVDQALFLLPDETTPSLGSDVVVLVPASEPTQARGRLPSGETRSAGSTQPLRLTLNATLDLGREFLLRGQGLNTGLRGQLQINQSPSAALPRVTGEIRTSDGTYRAYGQALQIESGVLRFIGPYDNPTLDILAVRTLPNQRAGVRILGTAQAPRVRLYADPDVPDSEKLALLVLGRPLSGAGAEAAILQQAALALLSGQNDDRSLVQALGLDEVSFQGESQAQDGSTTAAAITLGKRISNRLYLAYNRSLAGAVGTVQVFYDVSRRVTLRAQAGDDNALDLIFTVNYD